jgi:TspB protein
MRFGSFVAGAVMALALPGAAFAQAAPPANPQAMPRRVVDSAFALGAAYRDIGRAENAGATGHYIDASRTHYRSAIDRRGRNDETGASAEARLASDLARVSIDERPANAPTGPKDVPAPPTPRPVPGGPPDGMPMIRINGGDGPMAPDHLPMIRMMGDAMRMHHGGFDATGLAEILKVETGAEAHALAQNAVDANSAAQKAALAGNVAEASRQSRISDDLAAAVHDLAVLNHPELGNRIQFRAVGSREVFIRR